MPWITDHIRVSTRGDDHILDLTEGVQAIVGRLGLRRGQALVFVTGSTAGVTTIEYEPGLLHDLPTAFERIAPRAASYQHEQAWHDGNGHSHLQATWLGPSLTVPVSGGRLVLGTWQQMFLLECDVRSRRRTVVVTVAGD
jgi:secondary thiamine-phosphate synthase enzyme